MPAPPCERPGRRPNSTLEELWRQRLLRFECSALSAAGFCAKAAPPTASFSPGPQRLRQPPAEPTAPPAGPDDGAARLVPVRLLHADAPIEVVLPGGLVLR